MEKRQRDVQRAKYYRAEAEVIASHDEELVTIEACQMLVDRVQATRHWARLLGRRGIAEAPWIEVRDGRGSIYPCSEGWSTEWLMRLPRRARTEMVVLRQMAFFATPAPCAAHGPEFVTGLLELVDHFLQPEVGRAFRAALKSHRVHRSGMLRFPSRGPATIAPPRGRKPQQVKRTNRRKPRRTSGRPRDSQRSRVYSAEDAALDGVGRVFETFEEMCHYVRRVEQSQVWRRLNRDGVSRNPRSVRVGDGRGLRHARAIRADWRIEVPVSMREAWVVLHELAHLATPECYAAHGPEFTRNFHVLVDALLGEEAAQELLQSFRRHGVKVAPADEVAVAA